MEIFMPSRLQEADTCEFCLTPKPYHIAPLAHSRLLPWKYNFDGISQAQSQVECSMSVYREICAALKVTAAKIAAVKSRILRQNVKEISIFPFSKVASAGFSATIACRRKAQTNQAAYAIYNKRNVAFVIF